MRTTNERRRVQECLKLLQGLPDAHALVDGCLAAVLREFDVEVVVACDDGCERRKVLQGLRQRRRPAGADLPERNCP